MEKMINTLQPYILLISRFLLAAIFINAGWGKIGGYAGTQAYMDSMGVPGAMLPLVILLELGGGLAILFGLLTRFSALSIAVFSVISAFLFHYDPSNSGQMINFMKNISIAGGFLALVAIGPGKLSIDAKLNKHW
ncbi:DoxX family protein [Photobacterium indicum]|jgi:putative oxidoreductase|uniref:DoxX family protein n=1 Tax=Photobacterium indicum TaxID=81447 RepID=UPI002481EB86|nr:DoxX family protein [Photobacterium indicum]